MFEQEDKWKIELWVHTQKYSGFSSGYAFVNDAGGLSEVPQSDFFIKIPLFRTYGIHEYVDTKKPNEIQKIERQEINPFFLEYSFFDKIKRNKINGGQDLNLAGINFIKTNNPQLSGMTNQEVVMWFDYVGFNSLPWSQGSGQITIYDIENSQTTPESIVSKASILNIDIYR